MENTPNITQEELELMERFWQDKNANGEEGERLRERYANDPVWREKADGLRLLALGIQEAVMEDKLNNFHSQMRKTGGHRRWVGWAAAACIMGLTVWGTLIFLSGSPEEKLFAQFYRPDPGLPTLMGVSDHYEFENAMVSYKMGNYGKAIDGWRQLLKTHPQNDTLIYFIGSAYLAEGNVESAIQNLKQVIAVPESVFQSDAYWYFALGQLKKNKKDLAIRALQSSKHPDKEHLLRKLNPKMR